MNTLHSTHNDPLRHAVDATLRRLRRQALLRLLLYTWFALMTTASAVLIAREWTHFGTSNLMGAWPALVLQLVAVVTLVWLLRHQLAHVAELRLRAQTLRAATETQLRGVQRDRHQSIVLICTATLAAPLLLLALSRLVQTGAVIGNQSTWLAMLCLLPSVVIAAVHIPRLSRLKRTRHSLESTLQQLDDTQQGHQAC